MTTYLEAAYRACEIIAEGPTPPLLVHLEVTAVRRDGGPWTTSIVATLPRYNRAARVSIKRDPDAVVPDDDEDLPQRLAADILDAIALAAGIKIGGGRRHVDPSLN